eukprot:TRINITY_DN36251_c0_g2_i1.p1 TRINITY_DN36251_c0_g2~~TRINITY_DN36251_c0_g2_i1.p1  ORF type:complete len:320 (+),score=58.06 TRINITY_DN36251_c0_g2_i1:91-1050(+)
MPSLVGSEMCIRDRVSTQSTWVAFENRIRSLEMENIQLQRKINPNQLYGEPTKIYLDQQMNQTQTSFPNVARTKTAIDSTRQVHLQGQKVPLKVNKIITQKLITEQIDEDNKEQLLSYKEQDDQQENKQSEEQSVTMNKIQKKNGLLDIHLKNQQIQSSLNRKINPNSTFCNDSYNYQRHILSNHLNLSQDKPPEVCSSQQSSPKKSKPFLQQKSPQSPYQIDERSKSLAPYSQKLYTGMNFNKRKTSYKQGQSKPNGLMHLQHIDINSSYNNISNNNGSNNSNNNSSKNIINNGSNLITNNKNIYTDTSVIQQIFIQK